MKAGWSAVRTPTSGGRVLAFVCLMVLAVNLRAVAGSIGVSLEALVDALSLSGTESGLLTTLPVLCFAGVGVMANTISRSLGLHRAALVSLLALSVGMVARSLVDSGVWFQLLTVLALSGAAIGNVILPPLVKRHFPDRVGPVTAAYTAGVLVSSAMAPAATVPIAEATGSWRGGLLAWGVLAAVAVLPWLVLLGQERREQRDRAGGSGAASDLDGLPPIVDGRSRGRNATGKAARPAAISLAAVARSPMAWAMAVFFGVQSSNAYVVLGWLSPVLTDAGVDRTGAGLLVAMVQAIGIPIAFVLPTLAQRLRHQSVLPIVFALLSAGGWIGLWLAPAGASWLWALLLGLGCGAFPWVLLMIGLRTSTPAGTAALSGFVQPVGYLIAAVGPFGVGLLRESTGSWAVPLAVLAAVSLLLLIGVSFARPRWFEDTLDR